MTNTKFDLDPTAQRVCIIGVLIFLESFIGSAIILLTETDGEISLRAILLIILVAVSACLTYLSTFFKTEPETTTVPPVTKELTQMTTFKLAGVTFPTVTKGG